MIIGETEVGGGGPTKEGSDFRRTLPTRYILIRNSTFRTYIYESNVLQVEQILKYNQPECRHDVPKVVEKSPATLPSLVTRGPRKFCRRLITPPFLAMKFSVVSCRAPPIRESALISGKREKEGDGRTLRHHQGLHHLLPQHVQSSRRFAPGSWRPRAAPLLSTRPSTTPPPTLTTPPPAYTPPPLPATTPAGHPFPAATIPEIWGHLASQEASDETISKVTDDRFMPHQSLTYAELYEQMRLFARGLMSMGLRVNQTVSLFADNSIRWLIADQGKLAERHHEIVVVWMTEFINAIMIIALCT